MTNGDTPQHEAHETHESGEQKSQDSFNVDNLAQKGAPTYVAFKSSEEYVDDTNSVEETSQNNGSWKMSKLKSLFSKSNPDLSNKPADSKTSIKKWFSFSKFEDISKRKEEGSHKTLSLQDSHDNVAQISNNERQKISDIGDVDIIKKVEILSKKDEISHSETFTKNLEEITKDSKEEIFNKMEINEDKYDGNIGHEEHQTAFNQNNVYSGIQVNVPIANQEEEENQKKSFWKTEEKFLNENMCADNLDEEQILNDNSNTKEAVTAPKDDKFSNGTFIEKLEETTKDTLNASLDLSSKDISNEGEDNTNHMTIKVSFDDSFLNITENHYETNKNDELIEEVYDCSDIQATEEHLKDSEDQDKSLEVESNSTNEKPCIETNSILDDEQNVNYSQEEYQSINLNKSILWEDRFNPWRRQSLYEIPEENEDETSLENNSFPDYGFPTLINNDTLRSLNDFEEKEENVPVSESDPDEILNKAHAMLNWNEMKDVPPKHIERKKVESFEDSFAFPDFKSINDFEESEGSNISSNGSKSHSESESDEINKTDEIFDPWNEMTEIASQELEPNKIESFVDSFEYTEFSERQIAEDLTTETKDDSQNIDHLIHEILEHIINDIIVLKVDQYPLIDPFTDQNSIKLSMYDMNVTYGQGQEGRDGELSDNPTEKFCRRPSRTSESTASEDNSENESNEQNHEKDADFADHAQEPFLRDKRVILKQDLENIENEESVKEQDSRQESCQVDKVNEHEQDLGDDMEDDNINVDDIKIEDISETDRFKSVVDCNEKASQEERNLESSEEEQIELASDAKDEKEKQKDEKKRKSLKKRVKKALSFKGPRKAIQKLLTSEDKEPNRTTQRKQNKSNRSEVYDSEYFPPEAREEQEANLTRSFSLSMLKTQKQLSGLTLKRKFHSLGRATKPPPPSFFDSTSLNSSLSAQFPHSAPHSELDNIRIKVGQSTFYLLSDEAQTQGQPTNKIEPHLSTDSKDDFDLKPLEIKKAPSESGSDCVDSGIPDFKDTDSNENIKDTESELLSVYSNSDTDYFSIASSESSTNLDIKSIQIQRLTRSLDDISMLRMKKKKFSVSNEFLENPDQIAFHSIGHNDDEVSRTLSSSHPHLYNTNANSLVIINSNSNKSSWKPFKKLKQIFKPPSKLTEASVYSDTYLQKDPQVNQNPIYIASPEEELQEVTGFPNHQTPFSRHNLGKIVESKGTIIYPRYFIFQLE